MVEMMSGYDQAEQAGTHYIEESVQVYLMRDPKGTDTWVIDPATIDGMGLSSNYDEIQNPECRCEQPDECAATVARMENVDLPDAEELLRMLADALGYTVTAMQPTSVETVIVRDPDGGTDEFVFVNGEQVVPQQYAIDAGAGWTWEDWQEHRDWMLASASPAAAARLRQSLANPPGGKYVTGRGDEPWI